PAPNSKQHVPILLRLRDLRSGRFDYAVRLDDDIARPKASSIAGGAGRNLNDLRERARRQSELHRRLGGQVADADAHALGPTLLLDGREGRGRFRARRQLGARPVVATGANDLQVHALTDVVRKELPNELLRVADVLAVDSGDDVSGAEPRFGPRPFRG